MMTLFEHSTIEKMQPGDVVASPLPCHCGNPSNLQWSSLVAIESSNLKVVDVVFCTPQGDTVETAYYTDTKVSFFRPKQTVAGVYVATAEGGFKDDTVAVLVGEDKKAISRLLTNGKEEEIGGKHFNWKKDSIEWVTNGKWKKVAETYDEFKRGI